jgi:hypothetical protein
MTAIGRGRIAVGVATGLLILLPLAGAAGGLYAAYEWLTSGPPAGELAARVIVAMLAYSAGGALGFAAGVGIGWLIARGLFRWANRCGLGDIRDDKAIPIEREKGRR